MNSLHRRRRAEGGMTLVEIVVVVVIVGMLATIVTKVFMDRLESARVEVTKTQMAEIAGALQLFAVDNAFYPTTEQGLDALAEKPTSAPIPEKYSSGGYLHPVPTDKWGRPFIYICPGTHAPFEVISLGRDGVEGGEGYDADIHSWELNVPKAQP